MNDKKKLRRLPKRILSFVLTLVMVLTLMPGMSMEAKAAAASDGYTTDSHGLMEYHCKYGNVYDFKGYVNEEWKQVTYNDNGFIARVYHGSGLSFGSTPSFIADGKAIKITYTVKNTGSSPVSDCRFYIAADTAIAGEDASTNTTNDGGVVMTSGGVSFFAFSTTEGGTAVATEYEKTNVSYQDVYSKGKDPSTVTPVARVIFDSAFVMYFPEETIAAGEQRKYTLIVGMGDADSIGDIISNVKKAVSHKHEFEYSIPDSAKNTIVATCTNTDGNCDIDDGNGAHKVSLTLTASDANYSSSTVTYGDSTDEPAKDIKITNYEAWKTAVGSYPKVEFSDDDGATWTATPKEIGDYKIRIYPASEDPTSPSAHILTKDFSISINTWAGLQAAITNATNGSTIKLTTDIVATGDDSYLNIAAEKTVTIDLNGYKLDRGLANSEPVNDGCVLFINGNLTIIDSSNEKSGVITGGNNNNKYDEGTLACLAGGISLYNGTLILKGGTISNNKTKFYGGGIITIGGTLKIGGTARVINNNAKESSDSYTTSNIHFNDNITSVFSILTDDDALVTSGEHKAQIGLRFYNPSGEIEVATIFQTKLLQVALLQTMTDME